MAKKVILVGCDDDLAALHIASKLANKSVEVSVKSAEDISKQMTDSYGVIEPTNLLKSQPIVDYVKKHCRNNPCPCGSGKKYKKCCLNK